MCRQSKNKLINNIATYGGERVGEFQNPDCKLVDRISIELPYQKPLKSIFLVTCPQPQFSCFVKSLACCVFYETMSKTSSTHFAFDIERDTQALQKALIKDVRWMVSSSFSSTPSNHDVENHFVLYSILIPICHNTQ